MDLNSRNQSKSKTKQRLKISLLRKFNRRMMIKSQMRPKKMRRIKRIKLKKRMKKILKKQKRKKKILSLKKLSKKVIRPMKSLLLHLQTSKIYQRKIQSSLLLIQIFLLIFRQSLETQSTQPLLIQSNQKQHQWKVIP